MLGQNPEEEVAQIMEWRKNKTQESPYSKLAPGVANNMSEGNTTDAVSTAAMSSGNPYAMAAGAGLKVLAAKEARERQYRESLERAEQSKIAGQQNALQNLLQLSRGLKL